MWAKRSVPMHLNFFQAMHEKSCVDYLSSVWRRMMDDQNGQIGKVPPCYFSDDADVGDTVLRGVWLEGKGNLPGCRHQEEVLIDIKRRSGGWEE